MSVMFDKGTYNISVYLCDETSKKLHQHDKGSIFYNMVCILSGIVSTGTRRIKFLIIYAPAYLDDKISVA